MKLRNKIFLCIAMKILEVSAIVYIPYFLGKLFKLIPIFKEEKFNSFTLWGVGIFGIMVIIVGSYCIFQTIRGICKWSKWNWDFVNQGDK